MITAEFEFPQTKHADPLTKLYNKIKSSQKQGKKTDANSGASPKVEPCSQSDDELFAKIRKSNQANLFAGLFDLGDVSAYGGDESSADLALMNILAFWTGCDESRMERLFGLSALGQREKWKSRADYRRSTIARAVDGRTETYKSRSEQRQKSQAHQAEGPTAEVAEPAEVPRRPEFTNYKDVIFVTKDGKEAEGKDPIPSPVLLETLLEFIGGWPKRVGEMLFVRTADDRPVYLDSPPRLFAYIDGFADVRWGRGESMVSQERFHEHVRMNVEQFDAIETVPHFPPLTGIYYMHRPIGRPGNRLEGLLDKFNPATPEDRELIKAFIFTLFYGGRPGTRPAFLITGPDQDEEGGRGVGKSTLVQVAADELADGYVDVAATEDMTQVKTRLLSTEEGRKRVVLLDNVKSWKFSCADLEGLITNRVVSGRALYKGEGRRPNTLVFVITLNGAKLSKDLAQRVIVIQLNRPKYDPSWEDSVRTYIRKFRWELIADIKQAIEDEPGMVSAKTRWANWERDILSKTDMLDKCQKLIVKRQGIADDDLEEKELVKEYFEERLRERGHNPDEDTILIPSLVAADWLNEVTRNKLATNKASTMLASMGIDALRKSDRGDGRGWIWSKVGYGGTVKLNPFPDHLRGSRATFGGIR